MGHCAIQIVGFVVYPGCYDPHEYFIVYVNLQSAPVGPLSSHLGVQCVRSFAPPPRPTPARPKSIGIEITIVCIPYLICAAAGEGLNGV